MKTIIQIQTHTGKQAYYSQQPVGRLYGKMLQQVMVCCTFTRTLTPVLMKLNGSLRLQLYNEKSDVIHQYYSLIHRSRSTPSTMYCVVCKLNSSTYALRPTTIAKIRLRTDCCNAIPQVLSMGAKVPGNESSMERTFFEHSLLRSESSTSAKVPRSESSGTFPGNESSTGRKFPSVDFSLPGTKVQRNEKSIYQDLCPQFFRLCLCLTFLPNVITFAF